MTSDGKSLKYERILLSTGGSARRLNIPGSNLDVINKIFIFPECFDT
jgi:hypothetical protein